MSLHSNLLEVNRDCDCFPITREKVDQAVLSLTDHTEMRGLLSAREHYFASTSVFIAPEMVETMEQQITAIEQFIKRPAYQNEIFQRSALAAFAPTKFTRGVFMGYDFHITEDGPRLIEINSNAGGAFIVNAIQKAVGLSDENFEKDVADMFLSEWRLAGRTDELAVIAIVDEEPENQFHYPDMLLAASLLRRQGFRIEIVDPKELAYKKAAIFMGETKIDLIYNRITDFDFKNSFHSFLRQAWLDEAVVITPDPRHHALYADKQNLVTLSNREKRKELGASSEMDRILSAIPKTLEVTPQNAKYLWNNRKDYFFKPFTGFGGRAVYKGAKLTKKVWAHILDGGYIAQKLVVPPSRLISAINPAGQQKYDVRVYSYNGRPLLMAARVYQGQVTNLRTAGGGLAPVIKLSNPACHK